jgi:hypothetical protein
VKPYLYCFLKGLERFMSFGDGLPLRSLQGSGGVPHECPEFQQQAELQRIRATGSMGKPRKLWVSFWHANYRQQLAGDQIDVV